MDDARQICTQAAIAGKKRGPEIVDHWIDGFGEDAPAELLRRTMAARRAGDHIQAENLYQLAVTVQAELLSQQQSNLGWRERAADLFCAPALVTSAD